MPFKPVENPKCPKCSKPVYAAEAKAAAGAQWHKECFKCSVQSCRKPLDSTLFNEHKGELFCKSCYNRKHGPGGFRGAGASMEPGTETAPIQPTI